MHDLGEAWPEAVTGEQTADRNLSLFSAPMPLVYGGGLTKIHGRRRPARTAWLRLEEGLGVLIHLALVLFDHPEILPFGFHDLLTSWARSEVGISTDDAGPQIQRGKQSRSGAHLTASGAHLHLGQHNPFPWEIGRQ